MLFRSVPPPGHGSSTKLPSQPRAASCPPTHLVRDRLTLMSALAISENHSPPNTPSCAIRPPNILHSFSLTCQSGTPPRSYPPLGTPLRPSHLLPPPSFSASLPHHQRLLCTTCTIRACFSFSCPLHRSPPPHAHLPLERPRPRPFRNHRRFGIAPNSTPARASPYHSLVV